MALVPGKHLHATPMTHVRVEGLTPALPVGTHQPWCGVQGQDWSLMHEMGFGFIFDWAVKVKVGPKSKA